MADVVVEVLPVQEGKESQESSSQKDDHDKDSSEAEKERAAFISKEKTDVGTEEKIFEEIDNELLIGKCCAFFSPICSILSCCTCSLRKLKSWDCCKSDTIENCLCGHCCLIIWCLTWLSTFYLPFASIYYLVVCSFDLLHLTILIRNLFSALLAITGFIALGKAAKSYINRLPNKTKCPRGYDEITSHIEKLPSVFKNKAKPNAPGGITKDRVFPKSWEFRLIKILVSWGAHLTFIILLTLVPAFNSHVNHTFDKKSIANTIVVLFQTNVRVFHYQFFWAICYSIIIMIDYLKTFVDEMEENTKNLKKYSEAGDANKTTTEIEERKKERIKQIEGAKKNLEGMMKQCAKILIAVSSIDRKIRWFVLFAVIDSVCGAAIPIIQYVHFWVNQGTDAGINFAYCTWIIIRVGLFFGYTFSLTMRIRGKYKAYTAYYKHAVYDFLAESKDLEFQNQFTFARKELFNKEPSFTIAGFLNMNELAFGILAVGKIYLTKEVIEHIQTIHTIFIKGNFTSVNDYYFSSCDENM